MDTSRTAPHVNFELLKNFQNQTVRLVGEVTGTSGNLLHVKAADGGMVDVSLSQPGSVTDKYVMITGTATAGNTMNEDKHQALGNDYGERTPSHERNEFILEHSGAQRMGSFVTVHSCSETVSLRCSMDADNFSSYVTQTWRSTTRCASWPAHLNSVCYSFHDAHAFPIGTGPNWSAAHQSGVQPS